MTAYGSNGAFSRERLSSEPLTVTAWAAAPDETSAQLQRYLAQESSDLDTARFTLHRLRTTADFYRQRLQALLVRPAGLGPGEQTAVCNRAKELVREMETEVRAAYDSLGTSLASTQVLSPKASQKIGNYEVLRQSLRETQRQCETLNQEMVSQAEANESLVETLGAVKDANRKLLEQIRGQTAEIAQLTQHRVNDEERADQMLRKHELDRESVRQDAHHKALTIRESASERHSQVYRKLTDQLRLVKSGGELVQGDAVRIQKDLEERRRDFSELQNVVMESMAAAEQDLLVRLAEPLRAHDEFKYKMEEEIGELKTLYLQEREERYQENLAWGLKQGALATDKEDLHARLQRELSQLTTQLQAIEKRQLDERQSWAEVRSHLERQVSEQQQVLTMRKESLEQLQREVVAQETADTAVSSESKTLDQVTADLRRQARECDDALAAAVGSNEHLRAQMEEQRLRLQDRNSEDLVECRATMEQKCQEARLVEEADNSLVSQQIEALEKEAKTHSEETDDIRSEVEALMQDIEALSADVQLSRDQFGASVSSREAVEKEFNDAKRQFHNDALSIESMSERLINNTDDLEKEIRHLKGEIQTRKRWIVSREAESATKKVASEGQLRESQELLESCRERLRDAVDQRAKFTEEAEVSYHRSAEALSHLERTKEIEINAATADLERLQLTLESERRAHEQARDEAEREREMVADGIRHARDENRQRLEGAERQRARVEETCRNDLQQGQEYVSSQQRYTEELERNLEKVRALLLESEGNLGFIRQEILSEEREGSRHLRELDEEVHELSASLERSRREDAALRKQAEAFRFRVDQERNELRRGLDDLSHSPNNKTTHSPARIGSLTVR